MKSLNSSIYKKNQFFFFNNSCVSNVVIRFLKGALVEFNLVWNMFSAIYIGLRRYGVTFILHRERERKS